LWGTWSRQNRYGRDCRQSPDINLLLDVRWRKPARAFHTIRRRCQAAQNAAAARVEGFYNGFPVGTDAEGNEGYNAAQKAEEQLKLDFLSSFQNPQKNSANQTAAHKRFVEVRRR